MAGKYREYPDYLPSGIDSTPVMPSHWIAGKVKYVTESLDKIRVPLSAEERGERKGEYPYYGASGIIDYVDDYLFDEETILFGEDGANLIARSSPLAFLAKGKYWVNNHAHILKTNDGVNDYWVMCLENIDVTTVVSGSAQPKLTAEALGDLQIVYPPTIPEREKIANFLDHETAKIDTLIEKQQQLIKLLKEKRQAVISHAVTKGLNPSSPMRDSGVEWLGEVPEHWDMVPLKYLCNFSGGGTPSKDNLSYWTGGDIPWVSPKDMKSFWVSDTQDKITQKAIEESSTNFVESGALLMVVRSGILQRTIPIAINTVRVTLNQDMKSLKFNERMDAEYAANYILGNVASLLLEWSKEGATVESIEQEYLSGTLMPVPPREEQTAINEELKERMAVFQSLEDQTAKGITLLQERRTALISAAVTGKIDVRNWKAPELSNNQNKEVAA